MERREEERTLRRQEELGERIRNCKNQRELDSLIQETCDMEFGLQIQDDMDEYIFSGESDYEYDHEETLKMEKPETEPKIEEMSEDEEPERKYEQGESSNTRFKVEDDEGNILHDEAKSETFSEEGMNEYYDPELDPLTDGIENFDLDGLNVDMDGLPRLDTQRRRLGSKRRNTTRRHFREGFRSRIPPQYQLTHSENAYNNRWLNLDCVLDRMKELEGWYRQMSFLSKRNLETVADLEDFLEHFMTGNVRAWWSSQQGQALRSHYLTSDDTISTRLGKIKSLIINEFIGFNQVNLALVQEKEIAKAEYILNNMRPCDLCYWRNFVCKYEKWFHKLVTKEKYTKYEEQFFLKFPPTWKDELEKRFDKEKDNRLCNNLAGRIMCVQELMEEKCKEKYFNEDIKRFTNTGPCCDSALIEIPTRWGCRPVRDHRKKSSYKHRKKYKRYRKRFVPRRYKKYKKQYRRKRYKKDNKKGHRRKKSYDELRDNHYENRDKIRKQQDCPRKKKDCRCWLCKEEGHYANECPQRHKRENNRMIKQLEYINSIGYEPIESEPDSEISVYEYSTEEEIREFSDDPGSEWELIE
ncbi:hypothetical protein V6Z11_A05G350000 [Gossypium hirsutum]|uniref:CCHC-type domain-containing protein n=1 Tax=Gossypium hirsutum TaxID=3635 RepID=A0A1U8PR58_GOSHI|nr:uncharacterized protein LOC107961006 [Gossypium hirsutum]